MQYGNKSSATDAFDYYSSLSSVEYVEYDFYFKLVDPQQESFNPQTNSTHLSWGSKNVQTDEAISAINSLGELTSEIVVAVIDTGIDSTHSFFENRIIDSYVNLAYNSTNTFDDEGHGTHVAGIVIDNSPDNVKVMPYKVLNDEGKGSYSAVCTAIEMAIEEGIDVINLSLGGEHDDSTYNRYKEVVNYAEQKNIPIVVAAGNENADALNYCPANNETAITVSATNSFEKPAKLYSNYGECVDIAAPGSLIRSTVPNNGYKIKSGTSMATPFVSAAAAILKSINPDFSPQEIKDIIKNTASVPTGWDIKYGVGILDMENMISSVTASKPVISLNTDNEVLISSANNGIIYYTTDGSTPIIGKSAIYNSPINTDGISVVRAIIYKEGKAPSEIATLSINWEIDLTIRYKGRKSLESVLDEKIESYTIINEDIVEYIGDGRIQTHAIGKTKVIAFLSNNRRATFNITVKFANWQWIHKVFYEWFGILIWSF